MATRTSKQIEAKIRKRADAMADSEKRPVEPRDIASAAMLYAPGLLYPDKKTELDIPFFRRTALSITGVTLISGLLAITFGLIGYFAAKGDQAIASGAWDIAKIFAGAVVGSTGSTVATTLKRRPGLHCNLRIVPEFGAPTERQRYLVGVAALFSNRLP